MIGVSRRRSAAVLAANVAVVALVAACTSSHHATPPVPLPVITTTTPTSAIDYSTVTLAPIAGQTTLPPVAIVPGKATLNGLVSDSTGVAVPGAVVQLQRIVGSQLAQAQVATAADGTWVAQGVLGGLYRVRAWRAPDLAETTPQIVFLGATDTHTVNLTVDQFSNVQIQASSAPSPPIIDEPVNIVVEVTGAIVGADGVVRAQGQPGVPVELLGGGSWLVQGSATQTTSGQGLVSWIATCGALGPQPLSVLVNGVTPFPLNIAACIPVPPTTTTPPTTSTPPGQGTTTTTRRGRPTTTTSTTA